jgi:hypothetical protein
MSIDASKPLPEEAQRVLNELARDREKPAGTKRVFVGIPNMNQLNIGLVVKLFQFAMQRKYDPWFHFITEKRHTDFARNQLVHAFLESKCDVCAMIDADVDPHKDFLSLIELDKPIVSGNVFCWINGELMASIWQKAECEQCRNLKVFMEEGKIHDSSQYRINGKIFERWNPFHSVWSAYATKEGLFPDVKCRCKGTGLDPFVFRTHQSLKKGQIEKVDSIGSAAMLIQREVFEKIPEPWFRFLYKESGEILVTEDHYFCWKAQECGVEVWASPDHFCSHYKTVDLLQITGVMNRAYEMGKQAERVSQSIVIPEEKIVAL